MQSKIITIPDKKDLSVASILGEAWQLISGMKWPVFCLLILLVILSFINFSILLPITLINVPPSPNMPVVPKPTLGTTIILMLLGYVFYFLTWLIISVMVMLAVRRAIGLPARINLAYRDCKNSFKSLLGIALIGAAFSILIFLIRLFIGGSFLLNLLKIILYLISYYILFSITTFAIPVAVTKRYSGFVAFKIGLQAMNKNWGKIVLIYLIMFILIFISMIPLGIGLIWTFPMHLLVGGILFREVFGLQKRTSEPAIETTQ